MNSDPVRIKETTFANQMKEKWNALTDGDLEGIAGRKEPLVDKLQERYGYGKERAEQEADDFLRIHPELSGALASPGNAPAAPAAITDIRRDEPAQAMPKYPAEIPSVAEASASAETGYHHSVTIWISPRALRWIVPITAVALFVCLFLPWTGAYPSGYPAYTQTAFQTIWGGVSVNQVATESLASPKPYDRVNADPLMFVYLILVALGLVMVLAPLALSPARLQLGHPIIQSMWRRRVGLLSAVALSSFVVLMIQLSMGFGFEEAVAAKLDRDQKTDIAKLPTPEDREKATIVRGREVSPFNLSRTRWLHLAVACNGAFLLGAGLEFWLKRRGNRPLPMIVAHA